MIEPAMYCIGISHHTASLSIREKLNPLPQDIYTPWRGGQADGREEPAELAVLSTCNRLELYIAHKDGRVHSPIHAGQLLSIGNRGPVSELQPYLYTLTGMQVVEHLCRVAAGLDSQVVGETQILGQVVEAHRVAVEAGAVEDAQQGDALHPSLAHLAGAEGFAERILGQFLQQDVTAELFAGLHAFPFFALALDLSGPEACQ